MHSFFHNLQWKERTDACQCVQLYLIVIISDDVDLSVCFIDTLSNSVWNFTTFFMRLESHFYVEMVSGQVEPYYMLPSL